MPLSLDLISGHRIRVDQFMTLYIYKEIFVDHCYDVALGKDDVTIVDVGANTGLFALRMKELYPKAKVFCFEPFPPNFEALLEMIRDNQLEGVMPLRKAVGAETGTTRLYVHNRNVGGHSLFSQLASSNNFVEVDVVKADVVLTETVEHIDLLKLDCEGAEYEILRSLTPELAARIDRVIVEPTPKLYEVNELKSHMSQLGFKSEWRKGLYLFSRAQG